MRTSGVLKYPDAEWFAFMPCLFCMEQTNYVSLEVTLSYNGKSEVVEHDAYNGAAYVDMRECVQGLFGNLGSSLGYGSKSKSDYAVTMTYSVRAASSGGTYTTLLSSGSTLFVWGGLHVGETWMERRGATWFRGLPFFVDVYASGSTTCSISGGGASQSVSLGSKGLWHVPLSASTFATAKVVTLSVSSKTYRVMVEDCTEGAYLRWLDRWGRICHYLFKKGADTREVKESDYRRNNLAAWTENGWSGWNGHRDRKSRSQRLKIGASLVDGDTYEMLCDLVSSPMVEMLVNSAWVSVRVDDGTWTKSKAALQDFECEILYDDTPVGG